MYFLEKYLLLYPYYCILKSLCLLPKMVSGLVFYNEMLDILYFSWYTPEVLNDSVHQYVRR